MNRAKLLRKIGVPESTDSSAGQRNDAMDILLHAAVMASDDLDDFENICRAYQESIEDAINASKE